MPVDLVVGGLEKRFAIAGLRCMDVRRAHRPDRHAFVAPRINVARVFHRHAGVGGMQAADMLVCKPMLAADENLPQRPFVATGTGIAHAASPAAAASVRAAHFRACASAASRTHAPSLHASMRARMRSRLQGPSPLITALNSSQSIAPNS